MKLNMKSEQWRVRILSGAKGDLKKVLRSPLKDSFANIVETLRQDPLQPTQSFEKLMPPAAGFYSRRINGQHRVVYKVDRQHREVIIYSAWGHYER